MASQNQVSVCNIALLSVGARAQVSSISPSDGSTQADACSTLFTFVFEMLARSAYWNCLRKQAPLSLIQAAAGTAENPQGTTLPLPPQPWLYAYSVPSDSLRIRSLMPTFPAINTTTPITTNSYLAATQLPGEQVKFVVAYGTDVNGNPIEIILTNLSQAQAVYTVNQPNPFIWDSEFTSAFVASLAAYLVTALSMNAALAAQSARAAESIIMQARLADGNEGVTIQDHTPDWISGRNGYGYGQRYNGCCDGGYGNMNWGGIL